MPLTGLHTNWIYGSYTNDRDHEIKIWENARLAGGNLTWLNAHVDEVAHHIAVGYGYDLFENLNTLQTDLAGFVTTTSDLNMVYTLVNDYMHNGNPNHYSLPGLAAAINNYFDLGTESKAAELLDFKLSKYEAALDGALGGHNQLADSRERAAVMSLIYNMTQPKSSSIRSTIPATLDAITYDNRAEAWYEIRYNSNSGKSASQGIANRRYKEADLFGLYDTDRYDVTEAEAKEIMRMYTRYERERLYGLSNYGEELAGRIGVRP